ncbi:hypothetical protein RF11_15465 [Thelohanellus kitauei]|uniref:Uncharacterized protein n=1 Tax=Thelohanellus kitauei TaxID=669202 RepID=A0A0C2MK65_THEKT|nr:hypothetical protein RF11_15465 [Thelohanellus kitauei]
MYHGGFTSAINEMYTNTETILARANLQPIASSKLRQLSKSTFWVRYHQLGNGIVIYLSMWIICLVEWKLSLCMIKWQKAKFRLDLCILLKFGMLGAIYSDQSTRFESSLNIPRHLMGNGMVERFNGTKEILRSYVEEFHGD